MLAASYFAFRGGILIYSWLLEILQTEYELVRQMKESDRGGVSLIRRRTDGKPLVLRHFTGNAEVYQKLLQYTCSHLPVTLEVASRGEEHLILEEYIQGDTLDFLLKDTLFTAKETREIVTQVCQALWVLHSLGAIHRDVKPDNIILRGDKAVLIDFDAARLYKPEEDTDTQILGTTGFAAPEQYGLSQTDQRTDIFAVGVLINVMLTGKHPSKQLAPGRLGHIVARCTQVNPKNRYSDVLRLMEVL